MKMSTILGLRRFLTHADPLPPRAHDEDEDEGEESKVKVKVEVPDEGNDIAAADPSEISSGEPEGSGREKKRVKTEVVDGSKPNSSEAQQGQDDEQDEFDALLDDDDGIDYAAIDV